MIKQGLFAALIFASQTAFAALPPLAQSNREIQTILQSGETYRLLGGAERIDQITRTEKGYLLITAHKELLVDICYIRQESGFAGPAQFELFFHPPVDVD